MPDASHRHRASRHRGLLPSLAAWILLPALGASAGGSTCPADLDHDGEVTGADLTILLAAWGPCPVGVPCSADFTGSGEVGGEDLTILLAAWGICPGSCEEGYGWTPFGSASLPFPANGTLGVYALEVFDDGTGPALYAGGFFRYAGGVSANSVARWDGTSWSPLGDGLDGTVQALAVFDDGTGPALYAGGSFATSPGAAVVTLAKWDGRVWTSIPGAVGGEGGSIASLATFDEGTGPALFACGSFASLGGVAGTRGIARWDGVAFTSVGGGLTSGWPVVARVHDQGTGPSLYLGGGGMIAPGLSSRPLVRWTGSAWQAVCGSGACISGGWGGFGSPAVWALASAVDPTSGAPRLVAAGGFATPAGGIGIWDGSTWTTPGGSGTLYGWTRTAVATYPGASVSEIVLSGPMSFSTPELFNGVARFDGDGWRPMEGGLGLPSSISATAPNGGSIYPMPFALLRHDDGSGVRLFAGGSFLLADGVPCLGVAAWNGESWSTVGGGFSDGTGGLRSASARALLAPAPSEGVAMTLPPLVVGGGFVAIEEEPIAFLAGFDGTSWSSIGGGTNNTVSALLIHDDGAGPALVVGGSFTQAGDLPANSIARWDGNAWTTYGEGIVGDVMTLASFDDGTGPALYAGGEFAIAGRENASGLARWRKGAWEPMPIELFNQSGASTWVATIRALEVFDDGTGPALYAAGSFNRAGAMAVEGIAAWRNGAWSPVGTIDAGLAPSVRALAVYDDGGGPALFAGGEFTSLGGVPLARLAKWQSGAWSQVGEGADGLVTVLEPVDLGEGPRLAVGGGFVATPAKRIALWDGRGFSPLGLGTNNLVLAITSLEESLVIGGGFSTAGGVPSRGLGTWQCLDE